MNACKHAKNLTLLNLVLRSRHQGAMHLASTSFSVLSPIAGVSIILTPGQIPDLHPCRASSLVTQGGKLFIKSVSGWQGKALKCVRLEGALDEGLNVNEFSVPKI